MEIKSLRSTQLEAVLSMLNLNRPKASVQSSAESPVGNDEIVWKVLIYDSLGQEVIAPLLRVSDLRDNGITVHMQLFAERQPIPDVPAIYFVAPTMENINRICDVRRSTVSA